MPSIYTVVTAKEIATYWNGMKNQRAPFLGEALFPNRKKLGMEIDYIKGSRGIPVALKLSAFDVKATMRDRIGFDKVTADMPFFKEGMLVSEKDRQELNKVLESGNSAYIESIVRNVFDDVNTLVDGAAVQRERMRMQLLSAGAISLASNGQSYTYDYGMPDDHKIEVDVSWSNAAADILGDIKNALDTVEDDTGIRPVRAICSRKTWNYMLTNTVIKNSVVVTNSSTFVTDAMLKNYLINALGIVVEVYSKRFKSEAGLELPYFADDVFTLLPGGILGSTWFGTTPEESDLMASNVANVMVVETGVAVTTTKITDPVNVETKVTQLVLPSFEMADSVAILDVIK